MNIEYKVPNHKELIRLVEENVYTERYDGIFNSFSQVPKNYNFILMIGSIDSKKYDGEWVKINDKWERPDGSVPLYARAESCGALKL